MSLFLVLRLLVLSAVVGFAPTAATSESNYPIAKPNCFDRCGDVSIPFPFGLTRDCALNPDFFISCNTSIDHNPPKAFLGHGNVEVKRISVEGQINIKSYVARQCYDQGVLDPPRLTIISFISGRSESLQLYVNQTGNKFVAVGCDIFGYVYGYGDDGTYRTEGCIPTCNNKGEVQDGICSGFGCCETGIPNVARNVYVSVDSLKNYSYTSGVIRCSYVFVVQKEEFNFSSTLLTTRDWNLERETPLTMLIDWTISKQVCLTGCLRNNNTMCILVNGTLKSEGYRCACKEGYEGNAYLTGCRGKRRRREMLRPRKWDRSDCNNNLRKKNK